VKRPDEPVGAAPRLLLAGFAAHGLRAVVADEAAAAADAWKLLQPALVLLFPDASPAGWEVCRVIRSASGVPILVVSTSRSLDDVEDAIAWGADGNLVLPLGADALAARALAALSGARIATHHSQRHEGF
jgi:DNA-binding response OmpR family regulator